MVSSTRLHFKRSDDLYPTIKRFFDDQKEKILAVIPTSTVEHVGASAVPGALTMGDLDIQVQVKNHEFSLAVSSLREIFEVNHFEFWNNELALFKSTKGIQSPVDVALVVEGSQYDERVEFRDFLRSSPSMVDMYNQFKAGFEGGSEADYKEAKHKLFVANGTRAIYKNLFHSNPPSRLHMEQGFSRSL